MLKNLLMNIIGWMKSFCWLGLFCINWLLSTIFHLIWSVVFYVPGLVYRMIYPDYNTRKIKALRPIIAKINALREEYMKLSNQELANKTVEFKKRFVQGESLDDLLVESFAVVKEASRRVTGYEHYDEQLMAGIVLHRGCMTEMKTGEGKTLSATTAVYLNALSGKGVHVATVNDYLAKRDAEEMGRIYSFLGLTCGALLEQMSLEDKKIIYSLDVLYATGSTLGFDYLYDNMATSRDRVCQRPLNFVIVDEADKLIDDGRTPLIISTPSEESLEYYIYLMELIRGLDESDYEIERLENSVYLTDSGLKKLQEALRQDHVLEEGETLYASNFLHYAHGLNQCLHAHVMMRRDYDYIVDPYHGILLVDEHTGRILDGRRLSHGLHQALEAKENVEIQPESKTSASISYQKFFGLYQKFSGMSGTCLEEAEEFYEIYGVDTVSIPTHKPIMRIDYDDEIYVDFEDKFDAVVSQVRKSQEKSQPVLVITGSVDISEVFEKKFRSLGWKVNVLNAKKHKEEADIIGQAGTPKAITIATNMAGRGTDIQLGGNFEQMVRSLRSQGLSEAEISSRIPKIKADIQKNKDIVLAAGGLYVIGTERNESRRVDDQARGRAGRQGDPGESKFMISLDDKLMKVFSNADWMKGLISKGDPIHDPLITRQVAKAQRLIEARNFDSRKYMLKYDAVLDEQRNMIYSFRRKYLFSDDLSKDLHNFVSQKLESLRTKAISLEVVQDLFNIHGSGYENTIEGIVSSKMQYIPSNLFQRILLSVIDELWSNHLSQISYLRQVTQLRAHGEKDPLIEYKIEASRLFEILLESFINLSLFKAFRLKVLKDGAASDLDPEEAMEIESQEMEFFQLK